MQPLFTLPPVTQPEAELIFAGLDLLLKKQGGQVCIPAAVVMQKLQNAQPFVEPVVDAEPIAEPAPNDADKAREIGSTLQAKKDA